MYNHLKSDIEIIKGSNINISIISTIKNISGSGDFNYIL